MTLVRAATPRELAWLAERSGAVFTGEARGIAALAEDGRILGAVGYDDWTRNAVQAHMAVSTAIAWRSLLGPVFTYPFVQLGLGLLLATIPEGNTKSLRMARHLGFRETYRIRDGWSKGQAMILLEMRREDCRFLAGHGKAVIRGEAVRRAEAA